MGPSISCRHRQAKATTQKDFAFSVTNRWIQQGIIHHNRNSITCVEEPGSRHTPPIDHCSLVNKIKSPTANSQLRRPNSQLRRLYSQLRRTTHNSDGQTHNYDAQLTTPTAQLTTPTDSPQLRRPNSQLRRTAHNYDAQLTTTTEAVLYGTPYGRPFMGVKT